MAHIKRQAIPTSWPVTRKGTAYVVRANADLEKGVPVLIALREMLKVAQTRDEVKTALNDRNVLLNGKPVLQEKNSISLLDVITLVPSKKNYRLELNSAGKFELVEIKEADAGKKVSKIIGKKMIKNKKIQINLFDGTNFLSDIKCSVNDSVLVDLKNKKIEKCIPLKEKTRVMVFAGKHIGEKGSINSIDKEHQRVEITSDKGKLTILIKQIMATE
ncbi:MAG: hypothetical protein AABX48_04235 [Nanoarchaeota archaeon]